MQTIRYRYFRWTPRTAGLTFLCAAVIPGIVGYMAFKTDVSYKRWTARCDGFGANDGFLRFQGKWDMRVKRRGDVMAEY